MGHWARQAATPDTTGAAACTPRQGRVRPFGTPTLVYILHEVGDSQRCDLTPLQPASSLTWTKPKQCVYHTRPQYRAYISQRRFYMSPQCAHPAVCNPIKAFECPMLRQCATGTV